MGAGTCKGPRCGKEILWVTSRKYVTEAGHHRGGKSVCLDPEPNPDGNVVLEPGDDGRQIAVVLANDEVERYRGERYMPHWKTCPDAQGFRKKPRSLINRIDRDHEEACRLNRRGGLPLIFMLANLLLVTFGCAATSAPTESFEWWTRKYEVRMGLEEKTSFRFGPTPSDVCAEMAFELGKDLFLVTYYDPDRCPSDRKPWDVAKHEACHRRMLHHTIGAVLEAQGHDLEAEADYCEERWYE